ncbi:hypothetical protein [Rhizobium leguminosarum]|uniref:hypothetical protein n=1 Tax=Rhizobium leguminosarum TaxID=384 RepID=UPI00103D1AD2|nr:hypothetical protein [Rhizobium leguminosarum]TBY41584.1 hypothetical protein E0H54_30805 [Rhizobium leguminosarum bv. viciae]
MATIISQLKGTATEIAAKVLGNGVLAWNETTKRWHGGDGATAGGFAMAREDEKNDGALGYLQEVKTNDYAIGLGDIGKALVANKATGITFTLVNAATLTSKFVAVIKNVGAGTLSLAPTGAELIDGVNAAISIATNSSLIIKGDGSSFRTYVSNGDVTAAAIHNATGKTTLADNDELGVIDSAASNVLKKVLFSNLIASIFTTARKIANAYFLSSFRLWDATDNTKGLAFDLSGITAATTRTMKMANRDTDLSKLGWELLAETVVSTPVAAVDFINVLSSAFDEYAVEITDVSPSTAANMFMRMSTDGGASWLASGYNYSSVVSQPSGATGAQVSSATQFVIASTTMLATTAAFCSTMRMHRPAVRRHFEMMSFFNADSGSSLVNVIGGAISQAADSIRFFMSTGNIVSGRLRVYGIRKG